MARKKKRGVKPGTKRGPYKRTTPVVTIRSIADKLETAIENLEARMQSATARINAILKGD